METSLSEWRELIAGFSSDVRMKLLFLVWEHRVDRRNLLLGENVPNSCSRKGRCEFELERCKLSLRHESGRIR